MYVPFKPCYQVISLLWFKTQSKIENYGSDPNTLPFSLEI